MRFSILLSLVVTIVVTLAVAQGNEVDGSSRENAKKRERSNSRASMAPASGKLAKGSLLDPESDVLGMGKNKKNFGKKRGFGKRKGRKANIEQEGSEVAEQGIYSESRRNLQENVGTDEMEQRRNEIRAKKQQEIRDRYANRDHRGRDLDGLDEDYVSSRHQELRDRHRSRSRDRSTGRRDRKRPEKEGRHAVLRRRFEKHANLFTPEEMAEIEDIMSEHKEREDKLDAARDQLNAQFDAVRDIDDRDDRLDRLEELKQIRANGRDAERAARDQLREEFQLIRERLEAKLRTELR